MPDEQKRLATIIEILHNPKTESSDRWNAIDLLVPPDDPMRYPGREVDEALLKLLEPDQTDDLTNFSPAKACRALASRGRTKHFDPIVHALETARDPTNYEEILGALVQLAQLDPARFNPRLRAILEPHLSQTNINMNEVLWAIWATDLKDLKPDLERLATRTPAEFEDEKAHSSGGDVTRVTGRFPSRA